MAPCIVIAAASQSFDQVVMSHWKEEGYDVRFELVQEDSKSSMRSIESIGDNLEDGESYAIVSRVFQDYSAIILFRIVRFVLQIDITLVRDV
jgi:hypothetical protein